MFNLSREEIKKIRRLAREIREDPDKLLLLAEEDYDFGCQRVDNVKLLKVPRRREILLHQSRLFLRALNRYYKAKRLGLEGECFNLLTRIEEIAAGNLVKRYFQSTGKRSLLFEALNDLVDAVSFLVRVVAPDKLQYYAFRDHLTDTYNRHFLKEEVEFLKSHPEKFPVGVVFVDMDDLKKINDSYGHNAGDLYLRKAVEVIRASVRGGDLVFRIGGDEFVVLIPKANYSTLKKIAHRVKKNAALVSRLEKLKPPLSLSVGVALWRSPEEDFFKVLFLADKEMYKDKRTKRS